MELKHLSLFDVCRDLLFAVAVKPEHNSVLALRNRYLGGSHSRGVFAVNLDICSRRIGGERHCRGDRSQLDGIGRALAAKYDRMRLRRITHFAEYQFVLSGSDVSHGEGRKPRLAGLAIELHEGSFWIGAEFDLQLAVGDLCLRLPLLVAGLLMRGRLSLL